MIQGLKSLLSFPSIYIAFQDLLGKQKGYRNFAKDYIRPNHEMAILDIGCGPASILEYLPENIRYVGVDLSDKYIQHAKTTFGDRAEFYCTSVDLNECYSFIGFDLVIGIGVLHHLTDKQCEFFFSTAADALSSGGRCLTLDPCVLEGQHPIAKLLINMDRGKFVRTQDRYKKLARQYFQNISTNICHDFLNIPSTHCIMECKF